MTQTSSQKPFAEIRILLVEDQKEIRAMYVDLLTTLGAFVDTADNGRKALEIIDGSEQPFDLIVSDVIMPEMDGLKMAKRIRESQGSHSKTKILLVTGASYITLDTVNAVDAPLVDGLIYKPFSEEQLLHIFYKTLNLNP